LPSQIRWRSRSANSPLRRIVVAVLLITVGCGDGLDQGNTLGPEPDGGSQFGRGPDAEVFDGGLAKRDGEAEAEPRWVGRVYRKSAQEASFSWQGAGLVAAVSGSEIVIKVRAEGPGVFLKAVIDERIEMRFEVAPGGDRTVTLAANLRDEAHRVEIYRDTEESFGVSTFLGFASGKLIGAGSGSGRLIEVIGDSISAAYGALGTELHGEANTWCEGTPYNSSWYTSYAALAGRAFRAEVSTLARSGWGLYRDGDANVRQTLPILWDNALGADPSLKWSFEPKPDAVVINLGTNDWTQGDPGEPFETTYNTFLERVRAAYPDAWIFLTIGSIFEKERLEQVKARLTRVLAARLAADDQRISTFDFGSQEVATTGCLMHPDAAEHERMAVILQVHLSEKLGW